MRNLIFEKEYYKKGVSYDTGIEISDNDIFYGELLNIAYSFQKNHFDTSILHIIDELKDIFKNFNKDTKFFDIDFELTSNDKFVISREDYKIYNKSKYDSIKFTISIFECSSMSNMYVIQIY